MQKRDRCLKVAHEYLSEGKSVAIDNTNANRDTRAYWLNLASKHDVPIRCVYFTASEKLCRHNDAVRALNTRSSKVTSTSKNGEKDLGLNPESRTILPPVAFGDFQKRFEEPRVEEGFADIVKVEFHFDGGEEQKGVWGKYWV